MVAHRSTTRDRVWWIALLGLCAVLLAPLLVVDVPPLLDYPNHLARVFVLASLPYDPELAKFYAPRWTVIPNLALDMVAPALLQFLPVHVVGRLLIAAAVLLPVLGTIAYNTALGGRWWSFGVGLAGYSSCLLYGFLNFMISLGLALLLAAAWLRWREEYPSKAFLSALIGAPVLFACHLMGLIFFGLLIGGAELYWMYRERNVGAALRRSALLLFVFAAPAGLYSASALQPLGGDAEFMPVGEKLMQLVTTFVNYSWLLDLGTSSVVIGLLLVCLLLRWGRVPGQAAVTMVLLLIVFLGAPYAWKNTYYLDTRFALMLVFMVFAGFVPTRWPNRFEFGVAAALVLLFVTRMALLTIAWEAHAADLADLRTVLAPVQPGAALYVAEAGLKEAPAYWSSNPRWRLLSNGTRTDEHLAALALIERRAYWPFEFDLASQQPIQTQEPYRGLAEHVGNRPNWADVAHANVCGFDYVLLMDADAVPGLPAERFRLALQSGFAALYTIRQCKDGP